MTSSAPFVGFLLSFTRAPRFEYRNYTCTCKYKELQILSLRLFELVSIFAESKLQLHHNGPNRAWNVSRCKTVRLVSSELRIKKLLLQVLWLWFASLWSCFFFRWPQRNSSESATHANTQGEESRLTALLIIPTPVSPLATHCNTLYTMLHMVVYCTHVAADRDFYRQYVSLPFIL